MSLSAARPMVMPVPLACADERGVRNFTKRVARFDTSAVLASITVDSTGDPESGRAAEPVLLPVGGARCGLANVPALSTVSCSGGVPRGGTRGGGGRRGGGALPAWETGCLGGDGCCGGRGGGRLGCPRGGGGGRGGFGCSGT